MPKKLGLSLALSFALLIAACGGTSATSQTTVGPRLKNSALPVCEDSTVTTVSEVIEDGPLEDVNCIEAGEEGEEGTAPIVDAPLGGASEEEDVTKNSTDNSQPDQTKTTSAPKKVDVSTLKPLTNVSGLTALKQTPTGKG